MTMPFSYQIQQWLEDFRNTHKDLLNKIYIHNLQEKIFGAQNYKYAWSTLQQLLKEYEPTDKQFNAYISGQEDLELWEVLNDIEITFNTLYLYYKLSKLYKDIVRINKNNKEVYLS